MDLDTSKAPSLEFKDSPSKPAKAKAGRPPKTPKEPKEKKERPKSGRESKRLAVQRTLKSQAGTPPVSSQIAQKPRTPAAVRRSTSFEAPTKEEAQIPTTAGGSVGVYESIMGPGTSARDGGTPSGSANSSFGYSFISHSNHF